MCMCMSMDTLCMYSRSMIRIRCKRARLRQFDLALSLCGDFGLALLDLLLLPRHSVFDMLASVHDLLLDLVQLQCQSFAFYRLRW